MSKTYDIFVVFPVGTHHHSSHSLSFCTYFILEPILSILIYGYFSQIVDKDFLLSFSYLTVLFFLTANHIQIFFMCHKSSWKHIYNRKVSISSLSPLLPYIPHIYHILLCNHTINFS
jgi:hypothetical protein